MDPQVLRRLREQSGLRLDREGRFWHGGRGLRAQLATGDWVEVDPATLASGAEDALYVRVPDGDRARLTRAAQLSLADHLREDAGAFWLELAGRRHRIGQDTGPENVKSR